MLVLIWGKCDLFPDYPSAFTPSYIPNPPPTGRTSGARLSIIESFESSFRQVYTHAVPWNGEYDDPDAWWNAIEILLSGASVDLQSIQALCISGTSASCLLVEKQRVTRRPRMYNYDIVQKTELPESAVKRAMQLLDRHAPPRHTTRAPTSSLAKLLAWAMESPLTMDEVLCHQSDYIAMKLIDSTTSKSDWHNCLKLGYDVQQLAWPDWLWTCLDEAGISKTVIPFEVISPGDPLGIIDPSMAQRLGLSPTTVIVGSTTDSNAAFFAAAGTMPSFGTTVTSLGSTLAIKQLSQTYVEDADRGVYSHRFPNFVNPEEETWLVGGASNVGCAILRQLEFSNEELVDCSLQIDPAIDSPLKYYPLTQVGERFPIADSEKKPLLEPVPSSRKDFLHGVLQSIGDVERDGFAVLQELGAPPPTIVYTCGGGSTNEMWRQLRERRLVERFGTGIQVCKADCTEASFGAALLAAVTFQQ